MAKPGSIIRSAISALFLFVLLFSVAKLGVGAKEAEQGRLHLKIVDRATGESTPARIELLNQDGEGQVAEDALLVGGDPIDRETVWTGTAEEAFAELVPQIRHPYSRKVQCYSTGSSTFSLTPGKYTLRVIKGIEYGVQTRELEIEPGERLEETIGMSRWINLSEQGWYSADNHLHIARSHKELDPYLLKWMQAEDVQVSSLLQWGHSKVFHNTVQYSFGPESVYREGDYILSSGQENPRTHVFGHTIILGASSAINFPDRYVMYRLFWEEAMRQGAVSGYAHWGVAAGAISGLSLDLPLKLIDFLEVLQFGIGNYNVWYNVLNTGFHMTPTAGSDYPFGGLPGIERFYTKIEGPLTYESWLEGIRRGRTFVTNGPLLEFQVNGEDGGADLILDEPGLVRLEGSVRFDATRDDVRQLEVIENGRLLRAFGREDGASQIKCSLELEIKESCWLALRIRGNKVGDISRIKSEAHSAPVYVTLKNAPGLSDHPRAKVMARAWIARLDELLRRLYAQVDSIGQSRWSDGVDGEMMLENRESLLEAVRTAKRHFQRQAN